MSYLPTYTERHAQSKERYSYDLEFSTRMKVLHILRQRNSSLSSQAIFVMMLGEVQSELLTRHGILRTAVGSTSGHPVIDHFLVCSTEDALSFIELCLRSTQFYMGGDHNGIIQDLNRMLEADSVGFELTPFRQVWKRTGPDGKPMPQGKREFPQFIKKGERTTHEEAVKPALVVLGDPRFATANAELMDAFKKVREGSYADAITSCGAAFESVLKTICHIKDWTYDSNKETCATLADKCNAHNLIEPFYAEIFKGIGTTRNKMGDAHGKGPKPQFTASQNHAEHMIAMTCSHITFAVRQAEI